MTDLLNALRDALTAARPSMTPEQQTAADALLAALAPPMEEPEWPSAAVMAKCGASASAHTLHVRAPGRGIFQWTCVRGVFRWEDLIDPRPLAPDEYREHGIPMPCEPVTDELVDRCAKAAWGELWVRIVSNPLANPLSLQDRTVLRSRVRAALRAAGHPEAGE